MKRYFLVLCCLLLGFPLKSQTCTYRYWFDEDVGNIQTGNLGNGSLALDVTSLNEGLHWLNIALKNTEDYSVTERYLFYKHPPEKEPTAYYWWFDNNIGNIQNDLVDDGHLFIDVTSLNEGLHWLNIALKNTESLSYTERFLFYKTPANMVITALNYWFDEDPIVVHSVEFNVNPILLDVSELSIGEHVLYIQLINDQLSVPESYTFYRAPMVRVFANPEEGGNLSVTVNDTLYTINAVANWDYTFVNWTSSSATVSTEAEYTFETDEDVDFIANFSYNTGIDENENSVYTLYPNPANDKILIESATPVNRCEIYRLDGSMVYSLQNRSEKLEINVSDLPSGTYIINVISDDNSRIGRFVKK